MLRNFFIFIYEYHDKRKGDKYKGKEKCQKILTSFFLKMVENV